MSSPIQLIAEYATPVPRSAVAAQRRWREPSASPLVMWLMGFVNRWLLLRAWFRVFDVVIPQRDRARLQAAVNPGTVAFIGPNHPEFGCDWMVDKELSTMVAPRMASWADKGIVNAAPKFWGANHLVANDGGDDALRYSERVALRGDAVLLHPEGSVRWTNDVVHPLFPGIARMALAAARRTSKPTYIVPVVFRYRFTGDVSAAIRREIGIIERELALPTAGGDFMRLQENILAARMERFGYVADVACDFFARQAAFRAHLIDDLARRYDVEATEDTDKLLNRLSRAIRGARTATGREDLAMADEAKRLGEFSREVYGGDALTQEQVSESLKRIRDRLLRRGWRNALARMLPRPLGPRVVIVGVPEPIRVDGSMTEDALLQLTRSRMQEALESI